MNLSLSNIAWDAPEHEQVLALLNRHQVNGIEVAPTKFWPEWQAASTGAALEIAAQLRDQGFAIPALQSILFGKPELTVFGDAGSRQALVEHIGFVAELAQALGARCLVFGSPKNRDPGSLEAEAAFDMAADVFHRIGEVCARCEVQLCIEPNPQAYDCHFMSSWKEVLEMVDQVDHPGIGLHLDTACIELEGDDVVEAINTCRGKISHFHITEANLGDLSDPQLDHARYAAALKAIDYSGWRSIEMRRSEHPLHSIERSLQRVNQIYR